MKKKLILVLLFFITGCSSKLNFNNDSDYLQNLLEEKKRLIEELESVKKLNELLTENKQQETATEIPQEKKSNIVVN